MTSTAAFRAAVGVCLLLAGACSSDTAPPGEPFEFSEPVIERPSDAETLDHGGPVDMGEPPDECEPFHTELAPDDFQYSLVAPNVYILLDTSGSMGEWGNCLDYEETGCCDECTTRNCCTRLCCEQRTPPYPIEQARRALDVIADTFARQIRFGFGTFPEQTTPGLLSCGMTPRLPVGSHPAEELKDAYARLRPDGSTPTGASLHMLDEGDELREPGDELHDRRTKAVVLITDGDPTSCEEAYPAIEQAANLASQGIRVYVVGFRSAADEETLDAIAEAGGTDNTTDDTRRFFVADDTDELVDALREISREVQGCGARLRPVPGADGEVVVHVGGEPLDSEDFSYDRSSGHLRLSRAECESLRDDQTDDREVEVSIRCSMEPF